ncbi:MAG TPA: hypothetical protein VE623_17240 [Acidimicrobiales bacterium]|nr:hypothetical protein [Acidimicrobiales bacterium]
MLPESPILFGGLMLVVGLALVAAVVRRIASRPAPGTSPTGHACDILGERYLRGEITSKEYRERRDALR